MAPSEAHADAGPGPGLPAEHQASRPWRPSRLRGLFAFALLAVGGMSVAAAGMSGPRPPARVVGGNLPVNAGATDLTDIRAHNSPTLVRNPTDPANLVVVNRVDSPEFSCALHVSLDGGASWRQTDIPLPAGEEPKCYAPDAAFGPGGTLHLLFVTLQGLGNVPNAAWTATSTDGGRSLSAPRRALGSLAFQVGLAADSGTPGRLYLTWLQAESTTTLGFPEAGYPILSSRSDDGGTTWSEPRRVSAEARARAVAPSLVAAHDSVFVAYLDLGDDRLDYEGGHEGRGGDPYAGRWSLVLARSRDGGATWAESVVDAGVVPAERFVVFIPPTPAVAVADGGRRVHVAFHDARLGDRDVWVWTSRDGGASFGRPVRVNDNPAGDGTSQYLGAVDAAPGGRVDAVYYDRRADGEDVATEVSFHSSHDGGRTFTGRLRVTDRAFDSRIGPGSERGMPDLGSRLALVSAPARALAMWADTRAGTDASRKQDLVRAVVEVPPPAGLPAPLDRALRAGGALMAAAGLGLLVWPRRRAKLCS